MLFTERRPLMIGLILLSAMVVVVIVFFVVRFVGRSNESDTEALPDARAKTAGTSLAEVVPPKEYDQQTVESLARLFVERIGSYSNQSNFQNINDVSQLMTPKARAWAEGLKKTADTSGAAYRGMTTKALTATTVDWKPKVSALVRLSTQRQEERDDATPRLYYQDAEVRLVFQNDSWLVDEMTWKDVQP